MKVKRIVANVETDAIEAAKHCYADILGLEVLMDHGWIATLGSRETMPAHISFASQGRRELRCPTCRSKSMTSTKHLKRIEEAGVKLEYDPVTEPRGVSVSTFVIHWENSSTLWFTQTQGDGGYFEDSLMRASTGGPHSPKLRNIAFR